MSNKEKEVKLRKDGLPKQPLNTFEKIVIALTVICVILSVVCSVAKWGLDQIRITDIKDLSGQGLQFDEKILDKIERFIPDTVELDDADTGDKYTVGIELNKDYNPENNETFLNYLDIINVYDWDGNPIGNEEKIQKYDVSGMQIKIMIVLKFAGFLTKVKNIVNNTLIVLILLDIVGGIFIAYFIWRRADDRRELRELALREQEIKRVTGISEEEARAPKKAKKKKKK